MAWAVLCWVAFTGIDLQAGPLVSTESPIGFFTNVANRLLQSQMGLSLNHIQVYPTNQYTPSVHRLLQVTANLYDDATNCPATDYPYLPSVFRPLFGRETGPGGDLIYISGFEEVTNTSVLAQPMVDLSDPEARGNLLPHNMVCGIPLVIGAKKGLPNFNEFAMYSQIQVTRKLQFHRPGTSVTMPVNEIDQMFVMGMSNVLGVEAWNSYAAAYPRPLQIMVLSDITAIVTNLETGSLLRISRFQPAVGTNILATTWAGYNPVYPQISFRVPLLTNLVFLSNMTYQAASDSFVPLTSQFERWGGTNFYLPNWKLTIRTRLQFALVDTAANRIVDYVNLAADTGTNIMDALSSGGACGVPYSPNGSYGSMWCTNRLNGVNADYVPTYGIQNQIEASMGHIVVDWNTSTHEFPPGMSVADAIAFFKGQFQPGYPFSSSNTFNAPYQPFRNIYLVTSWQANDPLVHYMTADLANPWTPAFMADSLVPLTTANLGQVNKRYEPWGGNPTGDNASVTKVDLTVKDPLIFSSDNWDFPTNLLSNLAWLGHVHRGTPWQTLYLKSFGITNYPTWFNNWRGWSGNSQLVTNWGQFPTNLLPLYVFGTPTGVGWFDCFFTQPTNDWRLASLVVSLLNTNDPRNLTSVNQPSVPAWSSLLDGMTVLTNSAPGQFDPVIVSSNSPQAATVAAALDAARASRPGHRFRDVAEVLAIPELSQATPWVDPQGASQLYATMNDEACEALPSQLLPLLRPDSSSTVTQTGGAVQVQFTGADGFAYAVQTSSNLLDWTTLCTNYPVNGSFNFMDTQPPGSQRRFYRSILRP